MSDTQKYDNQAFFSSNEYKRRIYPGEAAQTGLMTSQRVFTYAGYPDANHDAVDTNGVGLQFSQGDFWQHPTNYMWFRCDDNSQGAAVWQALGAKTFGGINVYGNATAQTIPTGATYTLGTWWANNGPSWNTTPDSTNSKITITIPGQYHIVGSFSFTCDTNNVTFYMAAFWNATEQRQIHHVRKIGTAGDVGSATFSGFIDVTTADTDIDIRTRHDNAGSVDLTVVYANVTAEYRGVT